MKKKLQRIACIFFRLMRISSNPKDIIAVIAPASSGSLGDQALIQGLYDGLKDKKIDLTEILILRKQRPQVINKYKHKVLGPYRSKHKSSIFRILWNLIHVRCLVILGADTLDGSYNPQKNLYWMEICDAAVRMGVPANIVSFSFSQNPVESVIERINLASNKIFFCSRDNNSLKRFNRLTNKCAELGADLAFLLEPESKNELILKSIQWCISMKNTGHLLIAVNANCLGYSDNGKNLSDAYFEAMLKIQKTHDKLAIIFIPHDFRDKQSDEKFLQQIYNRVSNEAPKFPLFMAKGPFDCWDAKELVGYADLLISGRMHLAIAALSQGVPAYCVAYRDKFEGLMAHFELKNNLMLRDNLDADSLTEFFQHAIYSHKKDGKRIADRISHVKNLAKFNLPQPVEIQSLKACS